ncbi:MAG: M20/M25/M40 family metallo-hydrolase [Elusimicrobiales bacterium]|nr:M20/M25/M40 family metallo-hydrolase [Elusimicrobiales bacterium]
MKILFYLFLSALPAAAQTVNHDLKASLSPSDGSLAVTDRVTLPAPAAEFIFTLHRGLKPSAKGASIEELPAEAAARYGINGSTAGLYAAYRVKPPKPAASFTLDYGGVINHPPGEQAQEYARSFSETPGVISPEGCYLSGSSGWYPYFEGALVTFRLEASLPAPYSAVAGGSRAKAQAKEGRNTAVWETAKPQDDITLTCGKYTEYARKEGPLEYQAFLRSPDPELAARYLEATGKYVRLYSDLIGAYPYGKFALVENFWDTGYGLPSFTLLGNKVIRLPFIISSSYPHEILHNWWGNGVFVDYASGNWCEGLTAYLADYLIAENRGKGRDYRMATLQKYADYVSGGADFPLTEFRSRHSSASEAVGYGKALMAYHMLRGLLGDANFRLGLKRFYADNAFRTASFSDLRAAFEKTTGPGRLKPFFDQWTARPGAPALALKSARVTRGNDGYDLEFTLAQTQAGPPYDLQVPAAFYLEGAAEPRLKVLPLREKEATFHYSSPLQRPLRLEIDPEFDLFRRVSPLETPPTLSRLLGASKPLIIIPAGEQGEPWRGLAAAWTKDKENLPVIAGDSETQSVPAASSYWLFGGENLLARDFEAALEAYGAAFDFESITIDNRRFPREGHTFVFAGFNPANPVYSGALVVSDSTDKLPLLAGKLPHYGKYSWLVFDRNMTSVATGIWKADSSPLAMNLAPEAPGPGPYPVQPPLAWLPSVFSEARMLQDARALAATPAGRAPGTDGHRKAAEFIQKEFRAAGLKPFGGGYRAPEDKPGRGNVLGQVEGATLKNDYLVLCAHYDHLPAKDGAVFPGADDNASGVAVLLELARHYSKNPAPRTIVFAAFDGEELGRQGSKSFVAALPEPVRAKVNAAVNFDTVGRLGAGKILALGSGSSDKWVHILRGAGFVTGYDYAAAADLDSSDQASFIEAGIPALQLFSGPHADYHKPSDTPDKLDGRGLVKIAEFSRELADYLAGTADFITRPAGAAAPAPRPSGERKASTGLVPDFSFQGKGVQAQDITPGSPLDKAGLRPGAVIIKLNGISVEGLREYSAELKKFSPGQKVSVTYLSGGAETTAEIELGAR